MSSDSIVMLHKPKVPRLEPLFRLSLAKAESKYSFSEGWPQAVCRCSNFSARNHRSRNWRGTKPVEWLGVGIVPAAHAEHQEVHVGQTEKEEQEIPVKRLP